MTKVTVDALVEQGIDMALEVNPQTMEAKQQKIAQLAKIPPECLERMTVNDLRNIATGILPNVRVKKSELIASIRSAIEHVQQSMLVEANALKQTLAAMNIDASHVITLLNTVAPEDAAKLLYGSLSQRMKAVTIAKSVTTDIRKLMRASNVPVAKQEAFDAVWRELIKDTIEETNSEYRAKVSEQMDEQKLIYAEPVVAFAEQALTKLSDWMHDKTDEQIQMQRAHNWQAVVYALSISTGRRPSEILSTRTTFIALDEQTIQYEGLAKTGVRAGSSADYVSKPKECKAPSICSTTKVMDGLRYLELLGKRSDIPHDNVNAKYGKPLGTDLHKGVRSHLQEIGIDKLYTCRHFYANYWMRLHERQPGRTMDSTRYIEQIMGHSDSRVTESYKDVSVWFAGIDYALETSDDQV